MFCWPLIKPSVPMGNSASLPPTSARLPPTASSSPSEGLGQTSGRQPTTRRPAESTNAPLSQPRTINTAREMPGSNTNGTLAKEVEELRQLHSYLLEKLQSLVGQTRRVLWSTTTFTRVASWATQQHASTVVWARVLYEAHVCRSHYLIVHGDGEREAALAQELQGLLEEKGQVVKGPWSITCGDLVLDTWQRLTSTAVAVVVLLSPALFQDVMLCHCLPNMYYSHQGTTVPLYLEPVTPNNLPRSLVFLSPVCGRMVPEGHWDPHPFIESLLSQCQRFRHFCREINALNNLLDNLQNNAD